VSAALVIFGLSCPDRSNSDDANLFGQALVNLNIGSLLDLAEKGPRVPNVKLVVLVNLQHLIAMHAPAHVPLKERLQNLGQQLIATASLPLEGNQRHALKLP
jgi:hypothetical protein